MDTGNHYYRHLKGERNCIPNYTHICFMDILSVIFPKCEWKYNRVQECYNVLLCTLQHRPFFLFSVDLKKCQDLIAKRDDEEDFNPAIFELLFEYGVSPWNPDFRDYIEAKKFILKGQGVSRLPVGLSKRRYGLENRSGIFPQTTVDLGWGPSMFTGPLHRSCLSLASTWMAFEIISHTWYKFTDESHPANPKLPTDRLGAPY